MCRMFVFEIQCIYLVKSIDIAIVIITKLIEYGTLWIEAIEPIWLSRLPNLGCLSLILSLYGSLWKNKVLCTRLANLFTFLLFFICNTGSLLVWVQWVLCTHRFQGKCNLRPSFLVKTGLSLGKEGNLHPQFS